MQGILGETRFSQLRSKSARTFNLFFCWVGEGKIFKVVSHIGNEQLLVLTKEKQNVLFFGF